MKSFSGQSKMNTPIQLPQSWTDMTTEYAKELECFLESSSENTSDPDPIWYYSMRGGIHARRPLGDCFILLTGSSGSGKSHTINELFGTNVCETGRMTSTTMNISLLRKEWTIHQNSLRITGRLVFIDVPGFCADTNGEDARHMKNIKGIREQVEAFKERKAKSLPESRGRVYPNVVLFILNGCEEKIGGENSQFVKTLQSLQSLKFTDSERNNLIIVVTHLMMLSNNPEEVVRKFTDMSKMIKKIVWQYLSILDVDVVPIENKPGVRKESIHSFKLPTDHENHNQLLKVMTNCAKINGDFFGELVLKNYKITAEVNTANLLVLEPYPETWRETRKNWLSKCKFPKWNAFHFTSLGFSYCPTTERVMRQVVCLNQKCTVTVKVSKMECCVPTIIERVIDGRAERAPFLRCSTRENKSEYEVNMKSRYNLPTDMKLHVKTTPSSRWLHDGDLATADKIIVFILERELCRFKLTGDWRPQLNPDFVKALRNLPSEYTLKTFQKFAAFFAEWGTHIITERGIGGTLVIEVDSSCETNPGKYLCPPFQHEIVQILKQSFNCATTIEACEAMESDSCLYAGLKKCSADKNKMKLRKHRNGKLVLLADWSPLELQTWVQEVNQSSEEIGEIVNIKPFYDLLPAGPNYSSLRHATVDYISSTNTLRAEDEIITYDDRDYFHPQSQIRLDTGQDVVINQSIHPKNNYRSVDIDNNLVGGFRMIKLNQFWSQPGPYECVRVSLSHGVDLIASPTLSVWTFNSSTGFTKTQLRFLCIGDIIGYYERDVNLRKTFVKNIQNVWHADVVGPCLVTESARLVVNGVLVGIRQSSQAIKTPNSCTWIVDRHL